LVWLAGGIADKEISQVLRELVEAGSLSKMLIKQPSLLSLFNTVKINLLLPPTSSSSFPCSSESKNPLSQFFQNDSYRGLSLAYPEAPVNWDSAQCCRVV
jgi:hypothetical protein